MKDYEQAIGDFLIKLRIFELDRGSSNGVGDFLMELGIQVIRSGFQLLDRGFFNHVAKTQTRFGIRVLDFAEVRSADE